MRSPSVAHGTCTCAGLTGIACEGARQATGLVLTVLSVKLFVGT
jgi:hypothetical protein